MGTEVETGRPSASRVTMLAVPAPVMPGTLFTTNGPLGTLPENWRILLMYTSTADGTTAVPPRAGSGNVTRSGRSEKLRRHCRPPSRTERDQSSEDEIMSPTCVVRSVAGSDVDHAES